MLGSRFWKGKSGKIWRCDFGGAEKRGEVGVTAGSYFLMKSQENQGLWEFERGFLYQI